MAQADNSNLIPLIEHFKKAAECSSCFKGNNINPQDNFRRLEVVEGGQPRWVGRNYFESERRVCFVLINPSRVTKKGTAWESHMEQFRVADSTEASVRAWSSFQDFLGLEESKWSRGQWPLLYYNATGLDKQEIAFLNVMLCAEDHNNYHNSCIQNCLVDTRMSLNALALLDPKAVILSGIQAINAFLKPHRKTKLTALRGRRDSLHSRIEAARESETLTQEQMQKIRFQGLVRGDIKEEIKEALPDCDFFWIGHYSARDADFEESKKDAGFLNKFDLSASQLQ